jgi:hypothetical protein
VLPRDFRWWMKFWTQLRDVVLSNW